MWFYNPLTSHSSISQPIPRAAQGPSCQFRWRQPKHSGAGRDVWAIDDITITPDANTNILSVEMMNMEDFDSRLASNLGKLEDSFCERMRSAVWVSLHLALSHGQTHRKIAISMSKNCQTLDFFLIAKNCNFFFKKLLSFAIFWKKWQLQFLAASFCNFFDIEMAIFWRVSNPPLLSTESLTTAPATVLSLVVVNPASAVAEVVEHLACVGA